MPGFCHQTRNKARRDEEPLCFAPNSQTLFFLGTGCTFQVLFRMRLEARHELTSGVPATSKIPVMISHLLLAETPTNILERSPATKTAPCLPPAPRSCHRCWQVHGKPLQNPGVSLILVDGSEETNRTRQKQLCHR